MRVLNHISIVARDLKSTKRFLCDILGYKQHHEVESWFINPDGGPSIHVIELDDAEVPSEEDMFHYYTHFAFETSSLVKLLKKVLKAKHRAFQMDMEGNEREVTSVSDDLSFGLKTLFVQDPDNNLWEFLQKGHSLPEFWLV